VATYRGASLKVELPLNAAKDLVLLGQRQGVSLFMTLLAAFQIVLSRYAAHTDISIGTPIAGRRRAELEHLIGFFVNTLVLRTELGGDPTVEQLLGRVRNVALNAYDHQDLPFEKLIEHLQPKRSLSVHPLFQVMFAFQNTPREKNITDLQMEFLPLDVGWTKFDLSLSLQETANGIGGTLEYSTDLFDADTMLRLAGHFKQVVAFISANPAARLSEIEMLSTAERYQVITKWNQNRAKVPDKSFHELFAEQVKLTPHALAAGHQGNWLTYAELNGKSSQIAKHLASHHAGPEMLVAVLSPRNLNFLAAILGLFNAGTAYMPLDPEYPVERIRQIVQQSHASIVMAAEACMQKCREALDGIEPLPSVLVIEDMLRNDVHGAPPEFSGSPRHLSYVIYTSGSTGTPKGVMIEQRGMVNHLYAKIRELSLSSSDAIGQNASQCFDISVWQFLAGLLTGGRTYIFDDEEARDPNKLLAVIQRQGLTVVEAVPSMLDAMISEVEETAGQNWELRSLRCVISTGEQLPPGLCRRWFSMFPEIPLLNAYGPTECSDDVTHHRILAASGEDAAVVPIGLPIENMQAYVLDTVMHPLPAGIPGELYIGGLGVGRGYLGEAALTAASFVPDPFSNESGARMYRCGDRVRWLKDGTLEYLGRLDHQVKIRGFRIELGEIEAALQKHSHIEKAAVAMVEDEAGQKQLVSYIVAVPGKKIETDSLQAHLRNRLPEYMIPPAFVMLDTLPLTAAGKLDRKALPRFNGRTEGDNYVAPRTKTEKILSEIWMELLAVKQVSVYDNFFDLGGHSLMASRVIRRIRSGFNVDLPVRSMFQATTIAELGALIDDVAKKQKSKRMPIKAVDRNAYVLN
jgi:amino acid adenylation domain-containing protein